MGSLHFYWWQRPCDGTSPTLGFPCELWVKPWSHRVPREDAGDIFGTSVCHHAQSEVTSLPIVVFSYFEGMGKRVTTRLAWLAGSVSYPVCQPGVPNLPLPAREIRGSSLQLSHKLPSGLLFVGLCSCSGQITL